MATLQKRKALIWTVIAITVLVGAVTLISAPKSPFTNNHKAYYLSEKDVNFIRPGLRIAITSADIAADGTVRMRVKYTDPAGLPLDRDGRETPGSITGSALVAYIPKGGSQYTSYTTRVQTSTINGQRATQAGADTGGTWAKVAEGEYTYTFGTKLPANYDKSVTHTVLVYGNRNLNEFEQGVALADAVYHWVPDGSSRPVPRDVIKTASCNKCHVDEFAFHGATGRTSMPGCVVCHTPQTIDPDTGNTVDMPVMIHKIHMGADLPSVIAGTKYQIIGNANVVHDYSEIAIPTDKRNCTVCHEQNTNAAQAANYMTKPSRAGCGSCHDGVDFAAGKGHPIPQTNDNECARCHIATSDSELELSVTASHTIPRNSKQLNGITWSIEKVDDAAPGKKPIITYKIGDGKGAPLAPSAFGRLFAVLAGPTTDYTTKFAGATASGYVAEDLVPNSRGANGTYTYTFATAIPNDAKGTFSISLEGRRVQIINPGTIKEASVQYGAKNAVAYFTVDGSPVKERRKAVAIEKCQACHVSVRLHGENRVDSIEHCVVCHNPVETDVARRPATAGAPNSIDFRQMIHNIHGGHEIKTTYGTEDYIVYGFGNVPHNYSHVAYPGRLASCDACHVNNSQQLPLAETHAKVVDPRGYLTSWGPQSAACLSCHRGKESASHALANTTALGESCGACHGPNADFSVRKVHASPTYPVVP